MAGPNRKLVAAAEAYFTELHRVRSSGGATGERSYYPALAGLLRAVGATLKPKVRLADDADDGFWRKAETPRVFAREFGAGLGEYLARALSHRAAQLEAEPGRAEADLRQPPGSRAAPSLVTATGFKT